MPDTKPTQPVEEPKKDGAIPDNSGNNEVIIPEVVYNPETAELRSPIIWQNKDCSNFDNISYFKLGHVILDIPPSDITITKNSDHIQFSTLRAPADSVFKSGYSSYDITVRTYFFFSKDDLLDFEANKLVQIMGMYKVAPLVLLQNQFILDQVYGIARGMSRNMLGEFGLKDEKGAIDRQNPEDPIPYLMFHSIPVMLDKLSIRVISDYAGVNYEVVINMKYFNFRPVSSIYGQDDSKLKTRVHDWYKKTITASFTQALSMLSKEEIDLGDKDKAAQQAAEAMRSLDENQFQFYGNIYSYIFTGVQSTTQETKIIERLSQRLEAEQGSGLGEETGETDLPTTGGDGDGSSDPNSDNSEEDYNQSKRELEAAILRAYQSMLNSNVKSNTNDAIKHTQDRVAANEAQPDPAAGAGTQPAPSTDSNGGWFSGSFGVLNDVINKKPSSSPTSASDQCSNPENKNYPLFMNAPMPLSCPVGYTINISPGGYFGSQYHYSGGERRPRGHTHHGVDYNIYRGNTPVDESTLGIQARTISSCKVVQVNRNAGGSGGLYVVVEPTDQRFAMNPDKEYGPGNPSRFQLSYMHLSRISVSEGAFLGPNVELGIVGGTGAGSTGDHLHFMIKDLKAGALGLGNIDGYIDANAMMRASVDNSSRPYATDSATRDSIWKSTPSTADAGAVITRAGRMSNQAAASSSASGVISGGSVEASARSSAQASPLPSVQAMSKEKELEAIDNLLNRIANMGLAGWEIDPAKSNRRYIIFRKLYTIPVYQGYSGDQYVFDFDTLEKRLTNSQIIINTMGFGFANKIAPIPIASETIPFYQHMGSSNIEISIDATAVVDSKFGTCLPLLSLQTLYNIKEQQALDLVGKVEQKPTNIWDVQEAKVLNLALNALGVHSAVINNINVSTVPGSPNTYSLQIGLTENFMYNAELGNRTQAQALYEYGLLPAAIEKAIISEGAKLVDKLNGLEAGTDTKDWVYSFNGADKNTYKGHSLTRYNIWGEKDSRDKYLYKGGTCDSNGKKQVTEGASQEISAIQFISNGNIGISFYSKASAGSEILYDVLSQTQQDPLSGQQAQATYSPDSDLTISGYLNVIQKIQKAIDEKGESLVSVGVLNIINNHGHSAEVNGLSLLEKIKHFVFAHHAYHWMAKFVEANITMYNSQEMGQHLNIAKLSKESNATPYGAVHNMTFALDGSVMRPNVSCADVKPGGVFSSQRDNDFMDAYMKTNGFRASRGMTDNSSQTYLDAFNSSIKIGQGEEEKKKRRDEVASLLLERTNTAWPQPFPIDLGSISFLAQGLAGVASLGTTLVAGATGVAGIAGLPGRIWNMFVTSFKSSFDFSQDDYRNRLLDFYHSHQQDEAFAEVRAMESGSINSFMDQNPSVSEALGNLRDEDFYTTCYQDLCLTSKDSRPAEYLKSYSDINFEDSNSPAQKEILSNMMNAEIAAGRNRGAAIKKMFREHGLQVLEGVAQAGSLSSRAEASLQTISDGSQISVAGSENFQAGSADGVIRHLMKVDKSSQLFGGDKWFVDFEGATDEQNAEKVIQVEYYKDNDGGVASLRKREDVNSGGRVTFDTVFPTFKIYLIEDNNADPADAVLGVRFEKWDNFYDYNAITNIEVARYRHETDVAVVKFLNTYGTLTTQTFGSTVYVEPVDSKSRGFGDITSNMDQYTVRLDSGALIAIDKKSGRISKLSHMLLQAGTKICIKMGYSNNEYELPVVFSGLVAEVQSGSEVTVVCQGFLSELLTHAGYIREWGGYWQNLLDLMGFDQDEIEKLRTASFFTEFFVDMWRDLTFTNRDGDSGFYTAFRGVMAWISLLPAGWIGRLAGLARFGKTSQIAYRTGAANRILGRLTKDSAKAVLSAGRNIKYGLLLLGGGIHGTYNLISEWNNRQSSGFRLLAIAGTSLMALTGAGLVLRGLGSGAFLGAIGNAFTGSWKLVKTAATAFNKQFANYKKIKYMGYALAAGGGATALNWLINVQEMLLSSIVALKGILIHEHKFYQWWLHGSPVNSYHIVIRMLSHTAALHFGRWTVDFTAEAKKETQEGYQDAASSQNKEAIAADTLLYGSIWRALNDETTRCMENVDPLVKNPFVKQGYNPFLKHFDVFSVTSPETATLWDIIQSVALRHPTHLVTVRPYGADATLVFKSHGDYYNTKQVGFSRDWRSDLIKQDLEKKFWNENKPAIQECIPRIASTEVYQTTMWDIHKNHTNYNQNDIAYNSSLGGQNSQEARLSIPTNDPNSVYIGTTYKLKRLQELLKYRSLYDTGLDLALMDQKIDAERRIKDPGAPTRGVFDIIQPFSGSVEVRGTVLGLYSPSSTNGERNGQQILSDNPGFVPYDKLKALFIESKKTFQETALTILGDNKLTSQLIERHEEFIKNQLNNNPRIAGQAGFVFPRRVCKTHIITSNSNMVYNNINTNDNIYNAIQFVDESGTPYGLPVKADDSILEYYTRALPSQNADALYKGTAMSRMFGIGRNMLYHHSLMNCYAFSMLKETLGKMYKGEIAIIGNSDIQPYDVISLSDQINNMAGEFGVESVIHRFTPSEGFITFIEPYLITEVSNLVLDYLTSIDNSVLTTLAESAAARNRLYEENQKNKQDSSICGPEDGTGYAAYEEIAKKFAMSLRDPAIGGGMLVGGAGGVLVGTSVGAAFGPAGMAVGGGIGAIAGVGIGGTYGSDTINDAIESDGWSLAQLGHAWLSPGKSSFMDYAFEGMFGWAAEILLNSTLYRQPMIIRPLKVRGIPFVAGIRGFTKNTAMDQLLTPLAHLLYKLPFDMSYFSMGVRSYSRAIRHIQNNMHVHPIATEVEL